MAVGRMRASPTRCSALIRWLAQSCGSIRAARPSPEGTRGVGDYTIPPINEFASDGDPETLGEIYAYGFRNAHRLSWDLADGTMVASDIGYEPHRGDQHRS